MTKILAIETYKECHKCGGNTPEYEVADKIVDKFNMEQFTVLEEYKENE